MRQLAAAQLPRQRALVTPHQTIAVAVRLFAIWLLVCFVTKLIAFASQFSWQDSPRKHVAIVLISAVIAVAVLALWFFPYTIARRLLRTSGTDPTASVASTPPDTWLAMGCALLGLWVLTASLPALIRDLVILNSSDTGTDTSDIRHWLLYELVRVALGVWLLFGAKGFRRIFWWARYAGMGEPSNNRRGP
jgi:hypothetical protein